MALLHQTVTNEHPPAVPAHTPDWRTVGDRVIDVNAYVHFGVGRAASSIFPDGWKVTGKRLDGVDETIFYHGSEREPCAEFLRELFA